MDYFSILFHKKFGDSVPLDGKYYEALFAASSGGGWSETTLTGTSPLTFKGLGQPLKDYHIFGETVQNGTLSPDYPVDVQGVGERTENLWDGYLEFGGLNGGNGEEYNPDVHYYIRTDYIPALKSETPVLCIKSTGVYIKNVFLYNENKIAIAKIDDSKYFDNGYGCIINLLNSCRYIRACFQSDEKPRGTAEHSLPEISVDNVNSLMINDGDTPIGYEPPGYKIPATIGNTTTPIYIGSEPLYRIGDYADEIDFANQQIIRRIKKVVLDGTETNLSVVGPYSGGKYNLGVYYSNFGTARKGKCSHFKEHNTYYDGLFNYDFTMMYTDGWMKKAFFSKDSSLNSLDAWRTWLAEQYANGTPVNFYYELYTPEITSITIPQLTTITGDNTLTIGTTVQPSAVSITGNIKPTGYGQLLDVNDVDIQDSNGTPIFIQG